MSEGLPTMPRPAARRTRFIAALSGKGGVGKTNVVTNLAIAASGLGGRVLVVDGDLGLANVDVLLGLVPSRNVEDLVREHCPLARVVTEGPRGMHLLAAASGRGDLAALAASSIAQLWALLHEGCDAYDLVLVDAGAGVGPSVVGLAAACDPVLVVTTPEPTSLADAYAAVKVVHRAAPGRRFELLVNEVGDELEARRTHLELERVTRRFLGLGLGYRGFLPADPLLAASVACQRAVVEAYPSAPSARQLVRMARQMLREGSGAGG